MQLRQDFEKLHLRSTFPSLNRQVTNEMPTGSLGPQKCLNIGIANLEGGGGGGNLRISYCNLQYLSLLSMKLQLWKLPQIAVSWSCEKVSTLPSQWGSKRNDYTLKWSQVAKIKTFCGTILMMKKQDRPAAKVKFYPRQHWDWCGFNVLGLGADEVLGPWCSRRSPWTLVQMKMEKCRLCRAWDPYCTWCILNLTS